MSPPERTTPSSAAPSGEDEIIELTEVVEGAAEESEEAEVVLDFGPGGFDQESLKSQVKPPEEKQDSPSPAPRGESFDDFLASLPDLPEDLETPPETPPPQKQAAPDLRPELAERLSDDELRELVRQVIQEKVESLVREVVPEMAAEAIDRELALWKKRLTESD